jgi:hypothetical protein
MPRSGGDAFAPASPALPPRRACDAPSNNNADDDAIDTDPPDDPDPADTDTEPPRPPLTPRPSPSANSFSFAIQGDPSPFTNPFSGSLGFTLAAPSGKHLVDYTSALSSALNGGANSGTNNLTGAAGTAAATYVPNNTAVGQTKTYSNTTTISDAFTIAYGVTQGGIQNFNQSFTFEQDPPPPSTVPGPLPLAGAGIAFGYSRKLRKRIAAA